MLALNSTVGSLCSLTPGEWWDMDLAQLDRNMVDGDFLDNPTAMTINGQLGGPFNCSGN